MEHNNMEQINLGPTQQQLKKIANGKAVVLKHTNLNGDKTFVVTQEQARRIQKARRLNKGVNLKLTQEQIGMNPFLAVLGTIVAEKLVSGAVKGIGKLIKGKGHTPGHATKKKRQMTAEQLENLRKGREKMIQNAIARRSGSGLILNGTNRGD